jgi:GT2 family glycosyltransferase
MMEHAAIVVVNYRGWRDSIACLESVLESTAVCARIILIENGSNDDSLAKLREWTAKPDMLARSSLAQTLLSEGIATPAHIRSEWIELDAVVRRPVQPLSLITIVTSPKNLGFAGGNNAGMRLALADPTISHIWLLNNDTIVDSNALSALLSRSRDRPDAGQCGSTVFFLDAKDRVQAFGGARYFAGLALAMHVGRIFGYRRTLPPAVVEPHLDYISGVSILATRRFVENVGLMSEDYFLYYEELDWALRGASEFNLAYAPESIVYHRGGASIGSNRKSSKRSRLSHFYLQRNRLRITRRFFPKKLRTVRTFMAFQMMARLARLQWAGAACILQALLELDEPESIDQAD